MAEHRRAARPCSAGAYLCAALVVGALGATACDAEPLGPGEEFVGVLEEVGISLDPLPFPTSTLGAIWVRDGSRRCAFEVTRSTSIEGPEGPLGLLELDAGSTLSVRIGPYRPVVCNADAEPAEEIRVTRTVVGEARGR